MMTGGFGGFLASVRDMGATGQQQQARSDSADDAVRGGAGGFFTSRGGGTKPGSVLPSLPATIVPVQSVRAKPAVSTFWVSFFIGCLRNSMSLPNERASRKLEMLRAPFDAREQS
jgi:hypothetical protein